MLFFPCLIIMCFKFWNVQFPSGSCPETPHKMQSLHTVPIYQFIKILDTCGLPMAGVNGMKSHCCGQQLIFYNTPCRMTTFSKQLKTFHFSKSLYRQKSTTFAASSNVILKQKHQTESTRYTRGSCPFPKVRSRAQP